MATLGIHGLPEDRGSWPVWPTLGWGIAVAMSAWSVYGSRPITEDDIQTEMERTRGVVDVDRDQHLDSP